MDPYDHKVIEAKWQKYWDKHETFRADDTSKKPKWYTLVEFPYPSGAGLHVGHVRSYTALDAVSRKKRMEGFNVLYPIGWDAFGLPTENYAIKTKIHPALATAQNVATFKRQLKALGISYDWSREVNTTDPNYYKWTQWIFLQFYKKGLAYKKKMPINWCLSCKIGLANEEVVNGQCERCGGNVEKREKEQWMLAITKYADRLIEDLETVDYLEKIKLQQVNWIGRSEGLLFTASVKDTKLKIQTFSAHFEAFRADTFVVIAPDHPFLSKLLEGIKNKKEVLDFCKKLLEKRAREGYEEQKEPEGIFTGRYIVDPVGNGDLPIWVANFALADYGTGIVKCSCHDERDFAFAKKYGLKLKPVLFPKDPKEAEKVKNLEYCFSDMKKGVLTEPSEFAGKVGEDCREKVIEYTEKHRLAERKVHYKLRDWIFSRQRYWGEPIPIVHCAKCGEVPIPEKELPLELPDVKSYEPTDTGESPLARIANWVNCKCPKCKGEARRETDTMPNWAGSSWYFLRYIDPKNDKAFADAKKLKYWTPIDLYNGGMEHTTLHLLYSRFWHKFLHDCGFVPTAEPYAKRISHGMILAEDGKKMSKSLGNVINPDEIVEKYGADTLRLYEMFMGPFDQAIAWDSGALNGVRRFLEKVWRIFHEKTLTDSCPTNDFRRVLNQSIKKITDDVNHFKFNTAISQLMILFNAVPQGEGEFSRSAFRKICLILSPFAPHIAEELWAEVLGEKTTLSCEKWPEVNPEFLVEDTVTYAVQVNGKLRGDFQIARDASKDEAIKTAKNLEKVKKYLEEGKIVKEIFVPGKIVGFVVVGRT